MAVSQAEPAEHSSLWQALHPCPTPWLCPCANRTDGQPPPGGCQLARCSSIRQVPGQGDLANKSFVLLGPVPAQPWHRSFVTKSRDLTCWDGVGNHQPWCPWSHGDGICVGACQSQRLACLGSNPLSTSKGDPSK